jgi:DNA-binding transcriptional LysR family regulator
MLNIRDLQCFVKVYELKSFSRTADELDMVQSQVSARVRRLEEAMETPLFVRLHRGVLPTVKGEVLYQHAKRVLLQVAELESAARTRSTLPENR